MLRRTSALLGVVLGLLALPVHAGQTQAATRPAVTPSDDTTTVQNWPASSVLGDPFVHETGKQGLEHLYNMEFEAARTRFEQIDERYPNHPVGPFLEGLNIWWRIMLDLTDTSHDEAFYDAMNEVIARCDELLDQNPDHFDATFFKGAALGFRGRLRSNRDRWFKAALDGKNAIGYVRGVSQRAPNNADYGFGKGMYDYYAAIIPEQYPVSKAIMWMLPDGDKERGIDLLKRTVEEGWYVQTEAAYFLTQVYYLYEHDYEKARFYVRWLRRQHPNNPFFHNFEGRVYARWGYWTSARKVFTEVVERCEADAPGYNAHMAEIAHYYLARERLARREYEDALVHLARLETLTSREGVDDNRFRVLGYLYQGMVYDAMDKRDMAVNRYRMVLKMDDVYDAHAKAERYLDAPYDG
jgi:tetratricopeptide (TPR) repeat protein